MPDLQARFEEAFANSKNLTERPDNATLLKLYGLYKQATLGDVSTDKPGYGDMVARAKWDAWNALKGLPREAAMQQYIDLIGALD